MKQYKNHMQKGGIKKPLIIGLGVGIVVIIAIVMIITTQSGEVKSVIAEFMEAGKARNVEAAYACWSPQAATEEEVAEYIESNYDDVFAGYERLNVTSIEIESSAGVTRCYASGAVTYTGHEKVPFEAMLVKRDGVWKLVDIYIGY